MNESYDSFATIKERYVTTFNHSERSSSLFHSSPKESTFIRIRRILIHSFVSPSFYSLPSQQFTFVHCRSVTNYESEHRACRRCDGTTRNEEMELATSTKRRGKCIAQRSELMNNKPSDPREEDGEVVSERTLKYGTNEVERSDTMKPPS